MKRLLLSRLQEAAANNWVTRLMAMPLAAAITAILLMAAGAIFALQVERISRVERLQQTSVQAEILASGIAAPLAFSDEATLREYLDALHADSQIVAVGAYGSDGRFVAGFQTASSRLPRVGRLAAPIMTSRDLIVTAAVRQGDTRLGTVYLHATLDSWPRRATRYVGLAVIVLMAALLIAMLGGSYASLKVAHDTLQIETANRLKAEEALRQSQKMEALGQLTGGVAHDFNNLLMVASGSLELMDRTRDPDRLDRLKSGMRQAIDRGAKLTQQLLSFSRRSPLKMEVVDLGQLIRGMDALLDRLTNNAVSLEIQIAPDLWPVEVDPSELEMALLNIVINARDAMPEGGTIRVLARNQPAATGDDGRVRIAISDGGTGIAPEIRDRIFEPFFTTKGAGHGTGLGLSQVYGFARASGGELEVDSNVGKGTTIALVIPRSHQLPVRERSAMPIVEGTGNRCILLVEDNDTVAEMVGSMLDEIGFTHDRVASADLALEQLESRTGYALVLSDMVMPGQLDGLELVRLISRRWSHLPYVLMTGYSEASATAGSEGIPLLMKPFSLEALSTQLDEAIRSVH